MEETGAAAFKSNDLLEPVATFHVLDSAVVTTEAEELFPQLEDGEVLHHVPDIIDTNSNIYTIYTPPPPPTSRCLGAP